MWDPHPDLTTIERLDVIIESGGRLLVAAGLLTALVRATSDERTIWHAIGDEPAGVPDGRAIGCETCGLGATAFVIMNLLTMAASITFDPRLLWDP